MRLARLGSLHQSRLSFMRILTRRMAREAWKFTRTQFDIDATGVGHAIYTVHTPDRQYSLVAFAHDLPPEKRSDRVIAEAWDATFALFDGEPTEDDIERLSKNVPKQEAGRVSETELTLSRANRSVRLWEHVVERLAAGVQPDMEMIRDVGYLMRTTAVYGSRKFGDADSDIIADRNEMQAPFQAEMLTVFLIRTFVRDLVEHMAHARGGDAAISLDPSMARQLGIGNSTGLGMAPFLVNHPILFNNWIMAREEAISRIRSLETASANEIEMFRKLYAKAKASVDAWNSEHPIQIDKLAALRSDIRSIDATFDGFDWDLPKPWDRLVTWAETKISDEGQEFLASLILEPYSELVDGLEHCLSDCFEADFTINGSQTVAETRKRLESSFGWAFDHDWEQPEAVARAWYTSAEKLEPRLGERFEEPISDYEQPLAPARDAARAYSALQEFDDADVIANFLIANPQHRQAIRRAQMSEIAPYSEIRDNTIAADMMPIDMLRAKLAFFGATHFDPRSDRWVRICMYAGAPYPEDLNTENADDWVYPETIG